MAVEGIDIDLVKVVSIAERLNTINNEIHSVLQRIESEINHTQGIWDSPAQKTLSSKYSKINKLKEDFNNDLKEYSNYLRNTAKEYGYVEKKINNTASDFM